MALKDIMDIARASGGKMTLSDLLKTIDTSGGSTNVVNASLRQMFLAEYDALTSDEQSRIKSSLEMKGLM